MRISSAVRRGTVVLAVTLLATDCSLAHPRNEGELAPQQITPPARKTVRSSELVVTVDTAPKAAIQAERLVTEAGGFVERSSETEGGDASIEARIPASEVEATMNRVAALGHEDRRTIATGDVTDQYTDLEARLRSSIGLRDRLQQLLGDAKSVADVLTVERELTRVQGDIEAMQSQLDRLKSQVQFADLSLTLQRKHQLGPLGYVGYGLWWGVSKLFVIR